MNPIFLPRLVFNFANCFQTLTYSPEKTCIVIDCASSALSNKDFQRLLKYPDPIILISNKVFTPTWEAFLQPVFKDDKFTLMRKDNILFYRSNQSMHISSIITKACFDMMAYYSVDLVTQGNFMGGFDDLIHGHFNVIRGESSVIARLVSAQDSSP